MFKIDTSVPKSKTPLRKSETESCWTNSVKKTLNIALERKRNAATWITSAAALDLSPCCHSPNTIAFVKKLINLSRNPKPKARMDQGKYSIRDADLVTSLQDEVDNCS
ncbi:unnamed protein product [Fraxinus pennsylvanica]|uniref:DUF6857 domain-containing protein n=1 Tax=Fraxinus pennsylvanica TaxID=56036 RepID=A0AAD1ZMK6_9LAMI|nr:unnamed protein product [Fraxinus pennsylvanica]